MTQDDTKDLTVISCAKTTDPANGLYEKALTLRYAGKNCKEIAEAVGVAHGTVRNWFSKGGLLERNYTNLKVMQHAKAFETQESLQEHIHLEAVEAHGRTVERARLHYDNPLGQRADEKLMEVGGLTQETNLKGLLKDKTYEQAKKMVDGLAVDLYGKAFSQVEHKIYTWESSRGEKVY